MQRNHLAVIVSLTELAETAKKAIVGRGHPLGIAEDMAWATRWLCARGLHGVDGLIHALEYFAPVVPSIRHTATAVNIDGGGAPLPALALAPSIGDLLLLYRGEGKALCVNSVTHPLLLVPFMARVAKSGAGVSIQWTGIDANQVAIISDTENVQIFAHDAATLLQASGDSLICQWQPINTEIPELFSAQYLNVLQCRHRDKGYVIDDKTWGKLQCFAHDTYVPFSEGSRLQGAGASLTDND